MALLAAGAAVLLGPPGLRVVLAQAPPASQPAAPSHIAPTPEAREAEQRAQDPAAPGPLQPIPFSHAIHADTYQMDCLYCHTGTDRSRIAGVPSLAVCMGCHLHLGNQLEGVRLLTEHWQKQIPVQWQQVHRLPEHVKFRHNRHMSANAAARGIDCQTCHGPVEKRHKLFLEPDTKWWIYGLPTQKLQMGWCVKCHRANEASQDCLTCHH